MQTDPDQEGSRASSPLMEALVDVQLELLEVIFAPVVDTMHRWPVWDYAARTLWRTPSVDDPADPSVVLRSLPAVARGIQQYPYGLVWRESHDTLEPQPDARVGLSIAGLAQLRQRRPAALHLADICSEIIGWLAREERALMPDPSTSVTLDVRLNDHVQSFLTPHQRALGEVSINDVIDVLQREYAPLNLLRQPDGVAVVKLGMRLVPFYGVQSAADYLARVGTQTRRTQFVGTATPLQLPQMLDHLSLALQTHPAWKGKPLVHAPDLRSAGSLMLDVADEAQFRDRMAALAAVLANLQAPPVPTPEAVNRFTTDNPGSLQRLDYWLDVNLTGFPGHDRTIAALDEIREAVRLRVEHHHPTTETRRRAALARSRLGLPALILDWGAAWDVVRVRVAEAFDTIRQEVQLAVSFA